MRRHQPREAGPDSRNTGPRGRGEQGAPLSGGPPTQCPLLLGSGAAPASPRPQLAGTRHAPFHGSQAGEHGVPSPGTPQARAACWKIRRRVTPKPGATWGGERRMAAMPTGLGHTVGGCPAHFQGVPPPVHPQATSLLPAPSQGSWSSPKFPSAPTHASRRVYGAPRSLAGHPPRAPTQECRGPANSAACAARSSPDPPEACPAPPLGPPQGPPAPTHLAEVAAAAPGLGARSGRPGA